MRKHFQVQAGDCNFCGVCKQFQVQAGDCNFVGVYANPPRGVSMCVKLATAVFFFVFRVCVCVCLCSDFRVHAIQAISSVGKFKSNLSQCAGFCSELSGRRTFGVLCP